MASTGALPKHHARLPLAVHTTNKKGVVPGTSVGILPKWQDIQILGLLFPWRFRLCLVPLPRLGKPMFRVVAPGSISGPFLRTLVLFLVKQGRLVA